MNLTNRWNGIVYGLWSPIYDLLLEGFFRKGRERAIEVIDLKPGERVLLIGVGTGADLMLLPEGVKAVGIDLSAPMLSRARSRLPLKGRAIELYEGDAQALNVESSSFDAVILNLILSVVPDPSACMREAMRALRPGGRAVIFDKFLPDGTNPVLKRRIANSISKIFGTDINRRLGDIVAGLSCELIKDEPSLLNGMYRVILLKLTPKTSS